MLEFIPTDAATLVSFLSSEMPTLLKYILKFSTTNKKNKVAAPIPLLTSQQIQEAKSHPSAIIQQTLKTVATIQSALNLSAAKANTLVNQRSNIEATLKKLRTFNNQDNN